MSPKKKNIGRRSIDVARKRKTTASGPDEVPPVKKTKLIYHP